MSGKSKKIIEIPVSDLVPYAGNPRENDAAVDRMIGSIEAFGFRIPILVRKKEIVGEGPDDPESGIVTEIVDGHLRLKAAEKMGMKTVPTMDASDMTEDQVQAFRIMVNQSVSWAEWNEERLKSELQSIASQLDQNDSEALARMTGFDNTELEWLLKEHDFAANVNPETGASKPPTPADMEAAEQGLATQFDGDREKVSVTCPNCAHDFEIDK